jgi:hypothetical protein
VTPFLAAYFSGQAGRPYSTTFSTDANNDGRGFNDLLYVPRDSTDVVVINGTWSTLDAYINADPDLMNARGTIVRRNAAVAPWTNALDVRVGARIPTKRMRFDLTCDLQNLINVFDSKAGLVQYAQGNQVTPVRFVGVDTSGKMIYDIAALSSGTFRKFVRDDLRSRWQAQFGLRLTF